MYYSSSASNGSVTTQLYRPHSRPHSSPSDGLSPCEHTASALRAAGTAATLLPSPRPLRPHLRSPRYASLPTAVAVAPSTRDRISAPRRVFISDLPDRVLVILADTLCVSLRVFPCAWTFYDFPPAYALETDSPGAMGHTHLPFGRPIVPGPPHRFLPQSDTSSCARLRPRSHHAGRHERRRIEWEHRASHGVSLVSPRSPQTPLAKNQPRPSQRPHPSPPILIPPLIGHARGVCPTGATRPTVASDPRGRTPSALTEAPLSPSHPRRAHPMPDGAGKRARGMIRSGRELPALVAATAFSTACRGRGAARPGLLACAPVQHSQGRESAVAPRRWSGESPSPTACDWSGG